MRELQPIRTAHCDEANEVRVPGSGIWHRLAQPWMFLWQDGNRVQVHFWQMPVEVEGEGEGESVSSICISNHRRLSHLDVFLSTSSLHLSTTSITSSPSSRRAILPYLSSTLSLRRSVHRFTDTQLPRISDRHMTRLPMLQHGLADPVCAPRALRPSGM